MAISSERSEHTERSTNGKNIAWPAAGIEVMMELAISPLSSPIIFNLCCVDGSSFEIQLWQKFATAPYPFLRRRLGSPPDLFQRLFRRP